MRKRFRFDTDSAVGGEILAEITVGWSAEEGDNAVTRSLPVDIDGETTTVVPQIGEILDVIVEIQYYPPLEDATGTVVFDEVTYDYILRAANVTSKAIWGDFIGQKIQSYAISVDTWSVYDDDIGTILLGPSGVPTASDNSNDYTQAYSDNSYEIVFGMIVGPLGWNSLTDKLLRSLSILTTAGQYQIQFNNPIIGDIGVPKVDSKIITAQFILGWDEEIIP
jgi:hypothetical protein